MAGNRNMDANAAKPPYCRNDDNAKKWLEVPHRDREAKAKKKKKDRKKESDQRTMMIKQPPPLWMRKRERAILKAMTFFTSTIVKAIPATIKHPMVTMAMKPMKHATGTALKAAKVSKEKRTTAGHCRYFCWT